MNIDAYTMAQRFTGIKEVNGPVSNPQILSMLTLDNKWPEDDKVPWCSAFVNYVAWLLRLPRSKNLRARSWLEVGYPIDIKNAKKGYDVVIIKRKENDPGPEVIEFAGHVGFYAGYDGDEYGFGKIFILGGNQSNSVTLNGYSRLRLLGVRRIYDEPTFTMDNDEFLRMV
jgi:uncharacterized protein (TIGR02594 family)